MNSKSVFVTNGDAGHTNRERVEHDYYATHPSALEALLKREQFSHFIWEPACGGGHLSEVLLRHGHAVMSTDIVDRGFAEFDGVLDFMSVNKHNVDCDIITNPPYTIVTEWTRKALSVIAPGHKLAMFLKLTFLETQKRYELFMESPPPEGCTCSPAASAAAGTEFLKRVITRLPTPGSYGKKALPATPLSNG